MMTDFTVIEYSKLLKTLDNQEFPFQSVENYNSGASKRQIFLRHDIDALPLNSLDFASIQSAMGVRGSYYFRIVPGSWDEEVICKIAGLGHEVGYHYEDLSIAHAKLKAQGALRKVDSKEQERMIVDIGIESFKNNLDSLRKLVPVRSICMHGSPVSRWDSRLLWKYYDYRDFGIEAEPYFDIDFNDMLYLTDTGRRWNGETVSVRDKRSSLIKTLTDKEGGRSRGSGETYENWVRKPVSGSLMNPTPGSSEYQSKYSFRSTHEILQAAEKGKLPSKIMMTFHPQRWTDKPLPWIKELVWQNVKNVGKYLLIRIRG